MGRCVVMMELPCLHYPQIWPFVPHSITEVARNLYIVFSGNRLALWCVLMMYYPSYVKKCNLLCTCHAFFWLLGWWMLPLWRLNFGFRVVPKYALKANASLIVHEEKEVWFFFNTPRTYADYFTLSVYATAWQYEDHNICIVKPQTVNANYLSLC